MSDKLLPAITRRHSFADWPTASSKINITCPHACMRMHTHTLPLPIHMHHVHHRRHQHTCSSVCLPIPAHNVPPRSPHPTPKPLLRISNLMSFNTIYPIRCDLKAHLLIMLGTQPAPEVIMPPSTPNPQILPTHAVCKLSFKPPFPLRGIPVGVECRRKHAMPETHLDHTTPPTPHPAVGYFYPTRIERNHIDIKSSNLMNAAWPRICS